MASPRPSVNKAQTAPLQPEISAETERLLGCLLTPQDSTISNASHSHRWHSAVHGVADASASEHSAALDVGVKYCWFLATNFRLQH